MGYFSPELFTFLKQLKRNNNREWFAKNKERYVELVQEPVAEFVEAVGPGLRTISHSFIADPRKSLFRIYRDTRFSNDKTPYKTHVGVRFPHRDAADVHTPGFYLHLEPGEVVVAAGIWHPDSKATTRLRDAISERSTAWRKAVYAPPFSKSMSLGGESLVRPPRGYDPAHPYIDDLKRKDFYGVKTLDEKTATSDRFLAAFLAACKDAAPLMRFLCEATGARY